MTCVMLPLTRGHLSNMDKIVWQKGSDLIRGRLLYSQFHLDTKLPLVMWYPLANHIVHSWSFVQSGAYCFFMPFLFFPNRFMIFVGLVDTHCNLFLAVLAMMS